MSHSNRSLGASIRICMACWELRAQLVLTRQTGLKDKGARRGEGGYSASTTTPHLRRKADVRYGPYKMLSQCSPTSLGPMTRLPQNTNSKAVPRCIWSLRSAVASSFPLPRTHLRTCYRTHIHDTAWLASRWASIPVSSRIRHYTHGGRA
jgi:hypothetical protein